MNIEVIWDLKLKLRLVPVADREVYSIEVERIPSEPGVYVYLRAHGRATEALYVGQTDCLRRRITQYRDSQFGHGKGGLRDRKVMEAVRLADSGPRWLVIGLVQTKQGQQLDRVLDTTETALIRHFLSLGHSLINTQGTRIETDVIRSDRSFFRKLIPMEITAEKTRKRSKRRAGSVVKRVVERIGDVLHTNVF